MQPYLGDCVPPELKPVRPIRIGRTIDPIKATINGTLMLLAMAAVVVFSAGLLVLALSLAAATRGHGHEWYPYRCCLGTSVGGDCGPIDDKRIVELSAGGFLVDGLFYIAADKAQASLDGRFHGCFPAGKLGCFFAPPKDM